MQENKIFVGGGLDSDSAPEYVAQNDFLDALNTRLLTSDGQKDGLITSVTGNNIIPYTLATGANKGVGGEFFEDVMAAYIFIYNSNNRHRLVEVTYDEQVTTLFENITDSGGEDVLHLMADGYVKDLNLVDSKHLYFIDSLGKPCSINIERLKNGSYGVVTEDDFSLIKTPPNFVPNNVEYITNGSKQGNFVYNKTFQFRYQYVYKDNEVSAKSPISIRPLPDPEEGDIFDISKNNGIRVGVDFITSSVSEQRIKEIVLSFREDLGDWQTWKTVPIEYINTEVTGVNPLNPPPLPQDGDYKYLSTYVTYFYNDGVYPYESQLENDLAFDWVPRQVGAEEVVNGSVLTLSDLTEGYNKPVVPDSGVSFTKNVYNISIQNDEIFRLREYADGGMTNPGSGSALFSGVPSANDSLSIIMQNRLDPPESYTYTYTVQVGDTLEDAVNGLANVMNTASNPNTAIWEGSLNATTYFNGSNVGISFNTWTRRTEPANQFTDASLYFSGASVNLSSVSDVGGVQRILKKASSYQLALSYKDKYGRYFPLVTGENFVINTLPDSPSLHIDQAEEIEWNIDFTPPEGAVYYQWLLSYNRTHENWIEVPASLVKSESSNNTWVWDITSISDFIENNSGTILSYGYTQGDQARIVNYKNTTNDFVSYLTSDNRTLLIKSAELITDTENNTVSYILKTSAPSGLLSGDIPDGSNVLLELFTPKSKAENQVFYEVGPTYLINNGEHSTASGVIREGDSFIKFRSYDWVGSEGAALWMVESQNISDFKVSDFHNYGRPRAKGDVPENVRSKAAIRYSDVYLRRNNTNLLNRFYAERIYDSLSEEYGAIKHTRTRDDILVVIQERKVAYIPVLRSILEDLEEQQQVSISDRLLNPHSYSKSDNIGIGTRIMSLSSNRSQFYFVDPYKKLPVRAGLDGVKYIGQRFSTEMMNLIDNEKDIVGFYDNLNDEYVLRIGDVTYAYNETVDRWISRYSYIPEIGITATDKMFTTTLGNIYVHKRDSPKNTFYGVTAKPTIKFIVNSNPMIVKTFQSISVQSDGLIITTEDGVQTQLGQLSDLLPEDWLLDNYQSVAVYDREGNYYANFLRAKPDLINGDRLKGNWATIELTPDADDWNIFRIGIDYQLSSTTP